MNGLPDITGKKDRDKNWEGWTENREPAHRRRLVGNTTELNKELNVAVMDRDEWEVRRVDQSKE